MSEAARADSFFGPVDDTGAETVRAPFAQAGTLGEKLSASFENAVYNNSSQGLMMSLDDAYDRRIQEIEARTGKKLPHPLWSDEFEGVKRRQFSSNPFSAGSAGNRLGDARYVAAKRARFEEMVTELRQSYPDLQDAKQFEAYLSQQAKDRELRTEGGGLTGFAGEIGGSVLDPVNVSTLGVGLSSKTILGAALREAGVNASIEAGLQPAIAVNREALGLDYGIADAAMNVGAAAAFGGVFGGGGKSIEQYFARRSRKKILEEIEELPPEIRDDPDVQAAAAAMEKELYTEEAAGLSGDDVEAMGAHGEAVRAADEAAGGFRLNEFPSEPGAVSEKVAATRNYSGAGALEFFEADELEVDAKRFQFKSGGDAKGVTDALTGVKKWDDSLAANILVWEDAEGRRFVVNGHQRTGLARRLKAQGQEIPPLRGFVLHEAVGEGPNFGINAEEARAIGARINIAEGTGNAVDVAKVFRERPDLLKDGALNPRSNAFRDGRELRRLTDEAFMMIVNDVVSPREGAIVARLVKAEGEQMAVMSLLARQKPETLAEAEALVRDALAAGFARQEQIGLFGTEHVTESLIVDRAKILGGAVTRIRRDKRLFSQLDRAADDIEAAGNSLDRQKNKELADNANQIADIVLRTAHVTGPVADALKRAVQQTQNGTPLAAATRAFIDELTGLGPRALAELDGPRRPSRPDGRGAGDAVADGPSAGEGARLEGQAAAAEDAGSLFDDPAVGAESQRAALEGEVRPGEVEEAAKVLRPGVENEEAISAVIPNIERLTSPAGPLPDVAEVTSVVQDYLEDNAERLRPRDVDLEETTARLDAYLIDGRGRVFRIMHPSGHDHLYKHLDEKLSGDFQWETLAVAGEFITFRASRGSVSFSFRADPSAAQLRVVREIARRSPPGMDPYASVWSPGDASLPQRAALEGEVRGGLTTERSATMAVTDRVELDAAVDQVSEDFRQYLFQNLRVSEVGAQRLAIMVGEFLKGLNARGLDGAAIWRRIDLTVDPMGTGASHTLGRLEYGVLGVFNKFVRTKIVLGRRMQGGAMVHELAHLFLEIYRELARVDTEMAAEFDRIRGWLKADDQPARTTDHIRKSSDDGFDVPDRLSPIEHEKWAEGFESFVMEGVAPTPALADVFRQFKRWVQSLWDKLDRGPRIELSDDARALYARLFEPTTPFPEAPARRASDGTSRLEGEKQGTQSDDEPLLTGWTVDEEGRPQPVTQTRAELAAEIDAEDQMMARFEGCAYPKKGTA
jgi:hypothetical protein